MKTLLSIIAGIIFLVNTSFANEAKYNLTLTNVNKTSERTLEFDIYLSNPGESKEELRYAMGQYFIDINPEITKSGELTYSIVSSDLPEFMRPSSAAISGNQLRLSVNRINNNIETLPVIPASKPGLLIVRMKLETSADKFSTDAFDLKWSNDENNFRTKIVTMSGNKMVEITDNSNHIADRDNNGTGAVESIVEIPTEYSISQNYPNPFNPTTNINFELPKDGNVSIILYDVSGKEVSKLVNEVKTAGYYTVQLSASNLSSGMYFYRITSGNFVATKKMVVLK